MCSIRKRGLTWNAQVRISGWRSFTKTFKTKKDALAWGYALEDKLRSIPFSSSNIKNLKLKDLFHRYQKEISAQHKGFEVEVYKLKMFSRSWIGNIPVVNLTKHHFIQYKNDRLKLVKSGTVKADLMLIKRVLKTAKTIWDYRLPSNPLDNFLMPPSHKSRVRRLEKEELLHLLHYAKFLKNKNVLNIIEFAIETGMRRSELLKLQWNDIQNGISLLKNTKNGEDRKVPLTAHAKAILTRTSNDTKYVFPMTPESLKSAWRRLKAKANITNLRFHDLRHEGISRFFEMGLSIPEVSLISGHKDVRQLFQYTHLKPENLIAKYSNIFDDNINF